MDCYMNIPYLKHLRLQSILDFEIFAHTYYTHTKFGPNSKLKICFVCTSYSYPDSNFVHVLVDRCFDCDLLQVRYGIFYS